MTTSDKLHSLLIENTYNLVANVFPSPASHMLASHSASSMCDLYDLHLCIADLALLSSTTCRLNKTVQHTPYTQVAQVHLCHTHHALLPASAEAHVRGMLRCSTLAITVCHTATADGHMPTACIRLCVQIVLSCIRQARCGHAYR